MVLSSLALLLQQQQNAAAELLSSPNSFSFRTGITVRARKTTPDPSELLGSAFFRHCSDMFRMKGIVATVIKSILDSVMKRLQTACNVDEFIDKVPNIIGGSLYCDVNLPASIDMLLKHVNDKADRDCRKIKGFTSRYILL